VPQDLLNGAQIRSSFHHVGRRAVSEHVGGHPFGPETRTSGVEADKVPYRLATETAAAETEEQCGPGDTGTA